VLQITPHHHLLLAVKPVDFRKGIDSLAALCKKTLQEDPFRGAFFIFTNKLRSRVKILVYDGKGFWLCTRRFSKGRLAWWPTQNVASFTLNPSQLHILLAQGNPMDAHIPNDWRQVNNNPNLSKPQLPQGELVSKLSRNARATSHQDF
jgi:transposase